jgi:hypothetical protein
MTTWRHHTVMPIPAVVSTVESIPGEDAGSGCVSELLDKYSLSKSDDTDYEMRYFTGEGLHYVSTIDGNRHYGINNDLMDGILTSASEYERDGYILELLCYSFRDKLVKAALRPLPNAPFFTSHPMCEEEDLRAFAAYESYPEAFPQVDESKEFDM